MDIIDTETLEKLGLRPIQIAGTAPAYDPANTPTDDPVIRVTRFCNATATRLRAGEKPEPMILGSTEYDTPHVIILVGMADGTYVVNSPFRETLNIGHLLPSDLEQVSATISAFNNSHQEYLKRVNPDG